jgi:hypothetical protein
MPDGAAPQPTMTQLSPRPVTEKTTVARYDEARHKELWDAFVEDSMNGTRFHLQQFLAYHPANRFDFHHLLFFRGDRLVAVLPAGLREGGKSFESPLGASYGSFVTKDISAQEALDVVEAFEDYVVAVGFQDVYLTSAPVIYQPVLTQNLDFALLYRGYSYQRHYISHVIDMRDDESFLNRVHPTVRRNIRQLHKNGNISASYVQPADLEARIREFYPIMIANKLKHNAKPTHTVDELLRLNKLLPGLIEFFECRLDGEMIAGFLFFVANDRVFLSFYPMLNYDYSHLKPIYLLTSLAYEWAKERKFDFIDLGVSQDTNDENPMTPALSLIHFKEKFDSRGVLRSTLHKHYA